jgi:hypothetical protein
MERIRLNSSTVRVDERYSAALVAKRLRRMGVPTAYVRMGVIARHGWDGYWQAAQSALMGGVGKHYRTTRAAIRL